MQSLPYLHLHVNAKSPPAKRLKLVSTPGWGRQLVIITALLLLGLGGGAGKTSAQKLWESGDEVLRIQFRLQAIGYSYVEPTGVYDLNTQQAIMDFQRRKGLNIDGVVGTQTRPALFATFDPIVESPTRINTLPSLSAELPNLAFPPEGINSPPPSPPTSNASNSPLDHPVNLLAANRIAQSGGMRRGDRGESVQILQTRLQELRYYRGDIDGVYGVNTQDAVARFQVDSGISPDGMAGAETLTALGLSFLIDAGEQRYIVVVPGGNETLYEVRRYVNNARLQSSRRGSFINAGQFNNRNDAESLSFQLRARGLDARVSYNP